MKKLKSLLLVSLIFSSKILLAQTAIVPSVVGNQPEQSLSQPLVLLFALVALGMLPIVVMMSTSFVKISVVLGLVRNALGTQQIPPNTVITGLALIMTIYIMTPVGLDIYKATNQTINQGTNQPLLSQVTVNLLVKGLGEAKEPMKNFLLKHAHAKEKELFLNLARKMRSPEDKESVTDKDFQILIPAFVISELSEAFQIGFIVFLPFLVVDIVVTNILLSLGMFQVSPVTIALPFKLLLFVMVDGWHLIAKGLVMGYV